MATKTKELGKMQPAKMKTKHRPQRWKDIFTVALSAITVQEDFNKRGDDNYGNIDELTASIKAVGQITPAYGHIIGKNPDGTEKWVLTAGHRRYAALHAIAEETGKEQIMRIMKTGENDAITRLIIQYVENVKHPNNDWDRARIVGGLLESGLKQKDIGDRLGIPQPMVSKLKGLLDTAPEVQAAMTAGRISPGTVGRMSKALKNKGEVLTAAVNEATEIAKSKGKTKATDKDTTVAGARPMLAIVKDVIAKLEAKSQKARLDRNETFALALLGKIRDKASDGVIMTLIRNGTK